MLRINLLPPYIYDDLKKRNYVIFGGAVSLVVILACGFLLMNAKAAQETAQKASDEAKTQKEKYDLEVTSIEKVKLGAAATQAKSDFVNDTRTYNDAWAMVYENMRAMTTPVVVLNSMRLTSSSNLEILGFAPTELDVARWWMELRKSPDFAQVQFDLPAHPYPATGGTGTPATVAMGGGGAMSGMGGGPAGGSAGMMAAMMGGGGGRGMGGGGGGARSNASVGPTELEGRPGIAFAGHLILAKPLAGGKAIPAWGSARGGSGGGGMMGGMSGGAMGGGQAAMMSMMGGGARSNAASSGTSAAPVSSGKGKAGAED